MLSKGNKISYLCPECKSEHIQKLHHASIITGGQKSGECLSCNTFWPWSKRIKVSLKKTT